MKKTIAVSSLLSLLLSFQALADNSRIVNLDKRGDRIENRFDYRGNQVESRLDHKGNRIEKRFDRRSDMAAENGHLKRADHLTKRGDRANRLLDRKGERVDRRLDRKGNRMNKRLDRRAH